MDIIALLIGLGPLLGWGLFPTIASKFGGRPVNQIFGATVGTLIFAIILAVVKGIEYPEVWHSYFQLFQVPDGHLVKLLHLKRLG